MSEIREVNKNRKSKDMERLERLIKMNAVKEQLTPKMLRKAKEYNLLHRFKSLGKLIDLAEISKETGIPYPLVYGIFIKVDPYLVKNRRKYEKAIKKIKEYLKEKGIDLEYLDNFEKALRRET